jgi:hypothetical protein
MDDGVMDWDELVALACRVARDRPDEFLAYFETTCPEGLGAALDLVAKMAADGDRGRWVVQ